MRSACRIPPAPSSVCLPVRDLSFAIMNIMAAKAWRGNCCFYAANAG